MRTARSAFLFCPLFFAISAGAQQTQTNTTPSPAPKDPQAVDVVNRALSAAGGASAIKAVTDYTATGNVTYHWNPEAQGSVTVLGLGLGQIRVDANLPRGRHTSVISDGQTTTKAEDGTISRYPPPYPVPSSDAFPYQPPMFPGSFVLPHAQLMAVLNSPRISISYKGIVQLDGHSVYDIQVQKVVPGRTQPDSMTEYRTMDFYIDTSTLQLVMTQDNVPKHIIHQIRYSDYRPVSGVLVPFAISEQMGGQKTRDLHLGQISFNGGLQDSAFDVH
jgi:hypothetical protein